ncbi:MAG: hypothetical protein WCT11_03305 [Candidatus Magasanikbacteria bacterium]|jgi:hypothetical protein
MKVEDLQFLIQEIVDKAIKLKNKHTDALSVPVNLENQMRQEKSWVTRILPSVIT